MSFRNNSKLFVMVHNALMTTQMTFIGTFHSLHISFVRSSELTMVESSPGVMAKVLDYALVESSFKLQSCYYIHFKTNTFEKGMNYLIPFAID